MFWMGMCNSFWKLLIYLAVNKNFRFQLRIFCLSLCCRTKSRLIVQHGDWPQGNYKFKLQTPKPNFSTILLYFSESSENNFRHDQNPRKSQHYNSITLLRIYRNWCNRLDHKYSGIKENFLRILRINGFYPSTYFNGTAQVFAGARVDMG